MCGIVGYVGQEGATPIVIDGLAKLEYRGYDSAGLAIHDGQKISIVRAAGKLQALKLAINGHQLLGSTGIGHTRWATHGRPTEANAHPHFAGGVALVHNGIVENHSELRRELKARGIVFQSDTDTEILAQLTHIALQNGAKTLLEAVREALCHVRGTYALAVMSEAEPDTIVSARRGSPLVVGRRADATLCGSDLAALVSMTRDMVFLEDGDVAELKPGSLRILTPEGKEVERSTTTVDWSPTAAERGGFTHFMLKEIHEQPEAVAATLHGRLDVEHSSVHAEEIGIPADVAARIGRVCILACGSSYHAGLVARRWIESIAGVPVSVDLASEEAGRDAVYRHDDLVLAISQSGETYDTIAALTKAKGRCAFVHAIANVYGSQIPRLADGTLYTRAGPEVGVASTKCFTAQLAALLMVAIYLGRVRGTLDEAEGKKLITALREVPGHMHELLGDADYVRSVAHSYQHARDVLFLGRGYNYPIALEGALKLKEVSYAHAEGYAAGEMKHGPIALIDDKFPVVVIVPKCSSYDKTLGNVQEIRARDASVIAIATKGDEEMHELVDHILWLPQVDERVLPLLSVVPLQLLSYYVAARKGLDVDQPRNLAKTVTVE
jgi:glucosamine--fructose-6-phosphate aminotransferase (isomerizing)